MRVYEEISHELVRNTASPLFGLMGDGNLKLIPYLTATLGVPFYGARHESGAVAMADAYTRVSGEVAVCTFTQGPGLTNALTALVTARRGHTPMVVLCGDTPTAVRGLPQDIEQSPFLAAADIPIQPILMDAVACCVRMAFDRAKRERRPVALNLPTDVQEVWVADTAGPAEERLDRSIMTPPSVELPGPLLERAAALLDAAERPVIIAGRGAIASRQSVIDLADRCGALLATSLPAKGLFNGHPWEIGIAGGFATDRGRRLIGAADVVAVFGASLNHFTSRGGTLFNSEVTLLHCDRDAHAIGRFLPVTLDLEGDTDDVAQALEQRVGKATGYRTKNVRMELDSTARSFVDASEADAMDPRVLALEIDALAPPDRTLVVDGGHFMGFPSTLMSVQQPSHYVFTLDFGSIGLGLAAGVGAALARPDTVTVVAVGDGGFLMGLGELDTAVRYHLPLLVVVFNDEAYGAEMHFLRMMNLPDTESRFVTPSLDAVARGLGADAFRVNNVKQLAEVRSRIATLEHPLVLDCRISREVRAGWLEEAFERGTH